MIKSSLKISSLFATNQNGDELIQVINPQKVNNSKNQFDLYLKFSVFGITKDSDFYIIVNVLNEDLCRNIHSSVQRIQNIHLNKGYAELSKGVYATSFTYKAAKTEYLPGNCRISITLIDNLTNEKIQNSSYIYLR